MDNRFPTPFGSCPNPQDNSNAPPVPPQNDRSAAAPPSSCSAQKPPPCGAPVCPCAGIAQPQYSARPRVQYRRIDGKRTAEKLPRRRMLMPLIVGGICVLAALVAVIASVVHDQKNRQVPVANPDIILVCADAVLLENAQGGHSWGIIQ